MPRPTDLFSSASNSNRVVGRFWENPAGEPVDFTNLLNGSSVFLIAGGPSLLLLDLEKLSQPGIFLVALNNAVKTIRPDWWITVDEPSRFLFSAWMDPKITKLVRSEHKRQRVFNSVSWSETNIPVESCPNTFFFKSDLEFSSRGFLETEAVSWGTKGETGCRSVLLAALKNLYHLGAGNVFLLGVDFEMSESRPYHFAELPSSDAVKGNQRNYQVLNEWLSSLQPYFLEKGFHVWNCNPTSKLKSFPTCSLEDAVQAAMRWMPNSVEAEPTSGLYGRVAGTNDSARVLASDNKRHASAQLRRIDRSKCPNALKVESLGNGRPSESSSVGVLLLVDTNQEWILPWWHYHFQRIDSEIPVSVLDAGVSMECRKRLEKLEIDVIPFSSPLPNRASPWFSKPFAISSSPYKRTVFCDLDCELRADLSSISRWSEFGIVLGQDLFPADRYRKMFRERFYYNSGLIGVDRSNPVISQWCSETESLWETFRSDQEILNLCLYENEVTVVELPEHFHQLRLSGDHEDAVVMHWTGPSGKNHIRREMERLKVPSF